MTDLEQRRFIDTNVWLYAFITSQDEAKSIIARKLLENSHSQLLVSTQVINEVCVNMLRKTDTDEARLKQLIHSFFYRYEVVMLEESVLLAASDLRQPYSLSYWDSLIVATALAAGATVLYSEDMQGGQIIDGRLTIMNPFQSD